MKTEIITIGDELLYGQVIDTNAAWISSTLGAEGFQVVHRSTVGDEMSAILKSFSNASERADLIIITGGLGPTKDDLTREALCKFFNTKLVFNQGVFEDIENIFKSRNRDVSTLNRHQADIPEISIALRNRTGTAPGILIEEDHKIFVAMPGVPHEMKYIVSEKLIPYLREKYNHPSVYHQFIQTIGIGESDLSELIEDWEDGLPEGFHLAYLPAIGRVRLRLSAEDKGPDTRQTMDELVNRVVSIAGKHIYNIGEKEIEEVIGDLLRASGKTLSLAESCTGGYLGHLVTQVPGSSEYFLGSMVCYHNDLKIDLGVKKETLDQHGAVSEQTVIEMARSASTRFSSDYSIAISGIAGPGGGTVEKPVGTVWIAVHGDGLTEARRFQFGNERKFTIQRSALTALDFLRRRLIAVNQ